MVDSTSSPVSPDDVLDFSDLDEDAGFAAEMTNRQFLALKKHLDKASIKAELPSLLPKLKKLSSSVEAEVVKWLQNGWNTERLMRLSQEQFDDRSLVYALHWAFPQAYYSAFGLLMGFLKAASATEVSHSAVLKKHGALVAKGTYPTQMSAYAYGGKGATQYKNVVRHPMPSTLHIDEDDPRTWQTHICQLLNSTRAVELGERRKSMRKTFRTKRDKPKKALTRTDWARVAQAEGNTTILHFLYRKRIKANYRHIETYLDEAIDAPLIFDSLIHVVTCFNFVHEAFLRAIAGTARFDEWVCKHGRGASFLDARMKALQSI